MALQRGLRSNRDGLRPRAGRWRRHLHMRRLPKFRRGPRQIFPPRFVEFLESLGIDPTKEAEAYHTARLAPGRHHYGGWYHFIGTLELTGDFAPVDFGDGFTSWMRAAVAPRIESLGTAPVVELEFSTDRAPWVLDETELE